MTPESLRQLHERCREGGRACRIARQDTGQTAFVVRLQENGNAVCSDLSGQHRYLGFLLRPQDLGPWEAKDP